MVKIPRAEQTIAANPPPMPNLVGEGWTAPGRGLQQLGQGIASFGAGLESLSEDQSREDLHRLNVDSVNTFNAIDMDDLDREGTYGDGTGEGYATERIGNFDKRITALQPYLTHSDPRVRRAAELRVAQYRGVVQERAYRFENGRQRATEFNNTLGMIGGTFGTTDKRVAAGQLSDPDEFDNTLVANAKAMSDMINGYTRITPEQRRALQDHVGKVAAQSIKNFYGKNGPDGLPEPGAAERAMKIMERLQPFLVPAPAEVGPQGAGAPLERVELTAYSPQAGGSKMEGGYGAKWAGPDGKAEVRTLEDVAEGRSPYVTIAGDPSLRGRSYTIPKIEFIDTKGQRRTLENVTAVVHDTGGAFQGKPEGRFDLPIARDADDALMRRNHDLWKQGGVQMVTRSAGPTRAVVAPNGQVVQSGDPVEIAKAFVGSNETRDTQALAAFFRKAGGQKLSPADTAWCAAFVNAALGASGKPGSGTLAARDFLKYGTATDKPARGDIAVFWREDPRSWKGHVGFYVGEDGKGNVLVLGGNQSGGGVTVQAFPKSQLLGFRKPPEAGTKIDGLKVAQQPATPGPVAGTRVASRTDVATDAAPAKPETSLGQGGGGPTIPSPADGAAAAAGREPQTQVAQAEGQPTPAPRYQPGVFTSMNNEIRELLPAFVKQDRAILDAKIQSIDERAKKGQMPPPEEIERTGEQVRRYGTPEQVRTFHYAVEGAKVTKEYLKTSPEQMEQALAALRQKAARDGWTPAMSAQIDRLQKLRSETHAALNKDMLAHAQKVQVAEIGDVSPKVLLSEDGVNAMRLRVATALGVAQHFGRTPQFFTEADREAYEPLFKQGGKEMIVALQRITEAAGPHAADALREITKSNDPAAVAGHLMVRGGSTTAINDLAAGIRARAADPKYQPVEPSYRESLALLGNSGLSAALFATPEARERIIRAANVIYDVRMKPKKDPGTVDITEWNKALMEVIGENKVGADTYGGLYAQPLPGIWAGSFSAIIPPEIRQDAFPAVRNSIQIADLVPGHLDPGAPRPAGPSADQVLIDQMFGTNFSGAAKAVGDWMSGPQEPQRQGAQGTGAGAFATPALTEGRAPTAAKDDKALNSVRRMIETDGGTTAMALAGAPVDAQGRVLSVGDFRSATLVSIGDGKYWMAFGDPATGDVVYARSLTRGGRDDRFVLNLRDPVLWEKLQKRNPKAFRQ